MSLVFWCLVTWLFAGGSAHYQGISYPDTRLVRVLSAVPDAAWSSTLYHRNWMKFPVNQTLPERQNAINSQHLLQSSSKIQCAVDLTHTVLSLKEKWAIQMVDSIAKPESGILYGRTIWSGSYEECLDVSAPPGHVSSGFKGQYCWLAFSPKINDNTNILLKIGVCLPSSCDSNQMMKSVNELTLFLEKIPVVNKLVDAVPLTAISCVPETVTWSISAILCLTFIGFLAAIVIIATAFDLTRRQIPNKTTDDCNLIHDSNNINSESEMSVYEARNTYRDILLCFSAAKNGSAILDISARKGQLDCIHGIRFLSMTWVILGHSFIFSIAQIANSLEILNIMDLFSFQAALQAPFSVDSFFLLSGFLLTFLFLKDGASPKSIGGWIYFYVHRYIRLTPVYAVLLGFWASVWNYVGSGPFWQYDRPETINCDRNWWWNLLYINNFSSVRNMCMGWSWYLSNDMQFYIISPLFLIPLKRWPIVGFSLISTVLLSSWIATFFISFGHNFSLMFDAGGGLDTTDPNNPLLKQFDLIYMAPYCRIGPFLVGMLVAYCLSVTKSHTKSITVPKWVVAVGWISATACGLLLVYGPYHSNLGVVGSGFFTALSRSAWALSLGWMIFACLSGYGGPVNSFLSLKYFFPLSRLTYCAYLIHPMIIYWYFGTLQDTMYLSLTSISMLYLAFLLVSYGVAFVASLLFESPVVALEKTLRNMFKK